MGFKSFMFDHGGTIFTIVSSLCVPIACYFSARDTLTAKEKIDEAETKKGEELTAVETIKAGGKCYWRTAIFAAGSIGCSVISNKFNHSKIDSLVVENAAVVSALAAVKSSYSTYKEKVDEVYGEGSAEKISEEVKKDDIKEVVEKNPFDYKDDDGKNLYLISPVSDDKRFDQLLELTEAEFLEGMIELNRTFALRGEVTVNDLYRYLGGREHDEGDAIGWGFAHIEDCDCGFIDHYDTMTKPSGSDDDLCDNVHYVSFIWDARYDFMGD